MLKKLLFLLICTNLCATTESENSRFPTVQTVIIASGITVGVVVAAPYVLPVGTVIAIKAAVVAAAAKAAAVGAAIKSGAIVAAPVATTISTSITITRALRPYVFPTTEETLNQLLNKEASESLGARNKFSNCLIKNKASADINISGRPAACEDLARMFGIIAGMPELDNMTKTFNAN